MNGELDYNKSYKNALINEGKLKLSRHQSKEEKIKYKKKFKIYQQKQRRLQKQQRQVIQHFIPERFLPEQK